MRYWREPFDDLRSGRRLYTEGTQDNGIPTGLAAYQRRRALAVMRRAGLGTAMMHWANRPGGPIPRLGIARTLGRAWDPDEDPGTRKRKPEPKNDPKPPDGKRRKGGQASARRRPSRPTATRLRGDPRRAR